MGTIADAAVGAVGARGQAHRDAIAATLEAASVDDELGERLAAGTLEREATQAAGFGPIEGFEVLTGGGAETAEQEPAEDLAAAKRERAREARAAAQRAATAERAAERARRRADDLRRGGRSGRGRPREAESEAKRLADEARTERKRADRAARARSRPRLAG